MKSIIKNIYSKISYFLHKSNLIKIAVSKQHNNFPMNIILYNKIFSNKKLHLIFSWYGHHVFHTAYDARKSDVEYWSSEESLYYYIVSQYQYRQAELLEIFDRVNLKKILADENSKIVDLGCGTLKDMRNLRSTGILKSKQVIGVDQNPILQKYFDLIGGLPEGFVFYNGVMNEHLASIEKIDMLFVFGGTLQYLTRDEVLKIFDIALKNNIKALVIIGEGTDKDDHIRPGGEWNYNFNVICDEVGFDDNYKKISKKRNEDIFLYWCLFKIEL